MPVCSAARSFSPARHDVVCVLLEWLYDAGLTPRLRRRVGHLRSLMSCPANWINWRFGKAECIRSACGAVPSIAHHTAECLSHLTHFFLRRSQQHRSEVTAVEAPRFACTPHDQRAIVISGSAVAVAAVEMGRWVRGSLEKWPMELCVGGDAGWGGRGLARTGRNWPCIPRQNGVRSLENNGNGGPGQGTRGNQNTGLGSAWILGGALQGRVFRGNDQGRREKGA
jgi:hypothetical protein